MRHRILIVGLFVLLLSVPAGAQAIGLYASWWELGDLNDGFGFGARQRIFGVPLLSVEGRAGWIDLEDAEATLIPLEANALLDIGLFYGGAGAGYYLFDSDLADETAWFGLAGVSVGTGGVGVFAEAKYTALETKRNEAEVSAKGLALNAGVRLGW